MHQQWHSQGCKEGVPYSLGVWGHTLFKLFAMAFIIIFEEDFGPTALHAKLYKTLIDIMKDCFVDTVAGFHCGFQSMFLNLTLSYISH